jgi:hypothetical protein
MFLIIYSSKCGHQWCQNCSIGGNGIVINTQRNHISVERDIGYHSPKITIYYQTIPPPFHILASFQKASELFPSTQTQNNAILIMFWRNRLPSPSEHLLKMQTVNSSETLLSRLYVILTYTLCLFTNVKSRRKTLWMVHPGKSELNVPHYVHNQQSINVTALCTTSELTETRK